MEKHVTKQVKPASGALMKWIAGGAVLGAGALAVSAARSGLSIRGKLAASAVVPLMRRRARFQSAEALDRAIADNRTQGPALPPDAMKRSFKIVEEVRHGMRTFSVSPRHGGSDTTILYLAGGGYTFHPIAPHWTLVAGLVERSGATVVLPFYPLAPEATWKEAFATVTALYCDLEHTCDNGSLFVGGDSAGGGLALALAQQWQIDAVPLPTGLLLFSPFCDGTASDPAQCEIAKVDHMLSVDGVREIARRWAGDLPLNDRRISPLFASIAGLPPMLVIVGTHDILLSDANRLHDRAVADDTIIELHRYPGMFHVFVAASIPEGRRALDQAGEFIRRWCKKR